VRVSRRNTGRNLLLVVFTLVLAPFHDIQPNTDTEALQLQFSSFQGGSGMEWTLDITHDKDGNIYLVGGSTSKDFPGATNDSCLIHPCYMAYLTRINGATYELDFVRKIGRISNDLNTRIAVDDSGYIYIAGTTESVDFPTVGAFQPMFGGGEIDGFITKLSPDGDSLLYATFFGGSGDDNIRDIEVDAVSGEVYVCGWTSSSDFPRTSGITSDPQTSGHLFIAKLATNSPELKYSFIEGGNGVDTATGITVTAQGVAVIIGTTTSNNFITDSTLGNPDPSSADGIILWLNESGTQLVHSIRYGGSSYDDLRAVESNSAGLIAIAGFTNSSDLPTVNAFQSFYAGGGDSYVALFSSDGSALLYASYLGGSGREFISGLGLDDSGYIYGTGECQSDDLPLWRPYQNVRNGSADPMVVKFNSQAPYISYSSYIGGWWYQGSISGAIGPDNSFCIGGITKSNNYPTTLAFQPELAGGIYDAFVSCFQQINGAETCCRTAGDANHDGSVNIADVTDLITHIFSGGAAPLCDEEGDADGSGSTNIADVSYLVARVFAGGAAPVCGP
jgi:Beta-propeller repeat